MPSSVPDRLTVTPGRPVAGTVVPPGDKSITHRAYLMGALAHGSTRVGNANPGRDCATTLACLEALGTRVQGDARTVTIEGCQGRLEEPDRVLDCGNSGTTLRLLAGPLAAHPFLSVLAGDRSLNRRPVARVIEPLRRMGARLWARCEDTVPPLVVVGGPLRPIHHRLEVASAQVASAVLLAGLYASGETVIELLGPARDHTERLLRAFGVETEVELFPSGGRRVRLRGPACPRATAIEVAGDFSAASFLLAAAAATPGARVKVRGVGLNPTRTGLLEVLASMGAEVHEERSGEAAGEPIGDVTVVGPERLRAAEVTADQIPRMVDEVPAWAIAAATAHGTSRLKGAAELRFKESDRLAAIAIGLGRLGVAARALDDGLEIVGGPIGGGTVRSEGDHRIAMAFAALATRARGAVTVEDTASIATSYPGFTGDLARLGAEIQPA